MTTLPSTLAALAAGELAPRRGLHAYWVGLPGFYVVNPGTNIAVSAHETREQAQRDADGRDADYPNDPVALAVVEIA